LTVKDTKPKMFNMAKRECGVGHVTYFSNCGTP